MATIELTEQNFQQTSETGILIVDCWAEWCGPCRAFAPVFEAASERHPDVVFGKVDTEAENQLAAAFGIRAIPTLMVFRDGILLFQQPGMLPGEVLDELLTKVRALDMDDVRKKIAEENPDADETGDADE